LIVNYSGIRFIASQIIIINNRHTLGMTVVDYYYLTGNKPNATVIVDVDRQLQWHPVYCQSDNNNQQPSYPGY
ncbi:hypothetical protein PSY23_23735, partial [Shigella flexneri]|nr:hypothetical protein [Shigella flexneri]